MDGTSGCFGKVSEGGAGNYPPNRGFFPNALVVGGHLKIKCKTNGSVDGGPGAGTLVLDKL